MEEKQASPNMTETALKADLKLTGYKDDMGEKLLYFLYK